MRLANNFADAISSQTLPFQPGIHIAPQVPPKDFTVSNLFLRTIPFSMSQADRQDPEKGNITRMFSAALRCRSQIHQPIL
jgi:hypothetical protein